MPHTRRTLTFDRNWDITLDGVGRIALTGDDLATAQNVANEVRLFTEDAYFIQDQGIPPFRGQAGRHQRRSLRISIIYASGCPVRLMCARCWPSISSFDPASRRLSGSISFNSVEGAQHAVVTTYFLSRFRAQGSSDG
ncbi:MAG: hypothetical protein FWF31_07035 [Desulfobulbus sp.]|nr:hypothetical protein [Desulfobulbus sp.]